MNPIKLTDLHKSKLLEMCKKMFPQYEFDKSYALYKCPKDLFLKFGKPQSISWENEIHWFEFCMTKLWIKINSLLNHKTPEELMSMYSAFWDISNEKLHPINYLYEQFKQLKK